MYIELIKIINLSIIKQQQPNNNKTIQYYQHKLNSFKSKLRHFQLIINESQLNQHHLIRIKQFNLLQQEQVPEQQQPSNDLNEMRNQLFNNKSTIAPPIITPTSINQQIVSQNKQITQSLQISRQLLSATILQSELNIDNLEQQTKDLSQLNESFIKFQDLLTNSKQIIKFIEKQDKSDRKRIYLSIGFFLLCCCWVIYSSYNSSGNSNNKTRYKFYKNVFNWLMGTTTNVTTTGVSASASVSSILATTATSVPLDEPVSSVIENIIESTASTTSIIATTATSVLLDESVTSVVENIIESTTSTTSIIDTTATPMLLESPIESVIESAINFIILDESIETTLSSILEDITTTSIIEAVIESSSTFIEHLADEL
ncbi:SEC20 [[Candida] subhashii]|uniref:SEC20 n=1 Tax=[Candida] subhashii TaxID=561895 RepID=A0A8J5QPI8_9ASCO|nr:SEC20 [[Candida] subhashii]KAG7664271.1 SEC20 [[Candida] subhashii]